MFEIEWLHNKGMIASWRDYENMPQPMLDDARLLMEGEALQQKREAQTQRRASRGSRGLRG